MSISTKLLKKFKELDLKNREKLVKLAWEDRVSYQKISSDFGFSANEVEKFMRYELSERTFKRWRIRQSKRFTLKSKKAAILRQRD